MYIVYERLAFTDGRACVSIPHRPTDRPDGRAASDIGHDLASGRLTDGRWSELY